MKMIIRLSLLLLLCSPFVALAEIPEQVKSDFSPISGTVIMPIGDEFLVDLDASNNLKEGDILTLIMAGERIIHPVTKELIGSLERAKGYLQVTKVKSGYSYAKPIGSTLAPENGAQVKRFVEVTTAFQSSKTNSKLAEELKIAIPHLAWVDSAEQESAELLFSLHNNKLAVTNSSGAELKSYQYSDGQLLPPASGIQQADSFLTGDLIQKNKSLANQAIDSLASSVGLGGKDKRLENPGITQLQQTQDGVWTGPNLGGNPVGIATADFDGDGLQEIAVAMEDKLQIFRYSENKLNPIAVVKFKTAIHLLSLDAIDTDNNGKAELYLNANSGTNLSSQVVEVIGGIYQNTKNNVPWFFRVVDLAEQGRTLLAQRMGDAENHFNGNAFQVLRSGSELKRGSDFVLPAKSNLFSFTQFRSNNNDLLYASVATNDYLNVVTSQGKRLWKSSDNFGGSEVFFYNEDNTRSELIQPVFIQQRLLTLPTGEILSARNDGSRLFKRLPDFDKSHVVALKWDGVNLQESWKTTDQAGYLADFNIADADNDGNPELVMVVKFSHKSIMQKGRSNILIYELNQ